MTPKNILFVRSDLGTAGPAILMHKSAIALRRRGYNVIFLSGGGEYGEVISRDGFECFTHTALQVGRRGVFEGFRCLWYIRSLVKKHQIDVIHSYNLLSGVWSYFSTVFMGVEVVNTVLGYGKERCFPLFQGSLIAVSEFTKSRIYELSHWRKEVYVVYNSTLMESDLVGKPPVRNHDGFTICCVAMITGLKGHREAIEVAHLLRKDIPGLKLILVGDGSRREECELMVAKYGMEDVVSFSGVLYDVRPALHDADVFLHLTQFETFGIAIIEAMASGLPVVASRLGGIPEVVEDGITGILVDRDNFEEVRGALIRIYQDKELSYKMAEKGLARCRDLFTMDKLGEGLDFVYRSISRD